MIDRLRSLGVDCSGLQLHVSTREDRAFFTYYGANSHLEDLLSRPKTSELLGACRHVHFACAPDAESESRLLAQLRRQRARISVDVQAHVSWLTQPESVGILRQCDMFFPNEVEGGWISSALEPHDILLRLRDKGLRGVALKLGGKGAALFWRRRTFLADPLPVETVDTTGAGDCFNAGFIFAWLRGDPPKRCLEIANICGALSTRELGGVDGFPTLNELAEYEAELEKSK
jgi:sugar/nucleoside kinase (ribokinase family)